jgi:hypothetical protein
MGQAIGGNTTGTLIGTGVGLGIGYIIGNEMDKSQAQQMNARQTAAAMPPPPPSGATAPARSTVTGPVLATHGEVGVLGGTRWAVSSLNPRDVVPPFTSMLVEFRGNGRVITTTITPDGQVLSADESFRVVGDTLIINQANYIINARFSISGDQLVVSADRFSAVLTRLPG